MSPVLLSCFLVVTLAMAASDARAQSTISGGFVLEAIPLDGHAYTERRNCLTARLNRARAPR